MKTYRRVLLGLCSVIGLSSLVGCGSVVEAVKGIDSREQTITHVMGDTWQITAVWLDEPMVIHVRNHLNREAHVFCHEKSKRSALLLEAYSEHVNGGKGTKSTVVFRCVRTLDAPSRAIF